MRVKTSTGKTIAISHAPSVNLTTANSTATAMTQPPTAMHAPVRNPRSIPVMKTLLATPASSALACPPILLATSRAAPIKPRMACDTAAGTWQGARVAEMLSAEMLSA